MAQHTRASFCVQLAVEFIARNFTRATLCTLTFRDNVMLKTEASERWRPLKERMRRRYPDLVAVGVWQRQRRGAWHIHLVCSQRLAVDWLRSAAVACGFGTQLDLQYIDTGERAPAHDFRKARILGAVEVARYITRYLMREREPGDKGVRLVEYLGKCRISTQRFSWTGGMSRVWRAGVQAWVNLWGVTPSFDGWENVIAMGWDALDRTEREHLLRTSQKVYEWQNPEKFPF